MDFSLSENQEELRGLAARILEDRSGIQHLKAAHQSQQSPLPFAKQVVQAQESGQRVVRIPARPRKRDLRFRPIQLVAEQLRPFREIFYIEIGSDQVVYSPTLFSLMQTVCESGSLHNRSVALDAFGNLTWGRFL